jgi:hypothetical protein
MQLVRPFVDEFLPHRLFALNAFRESKIRPALLGRICRLLRNPAMTAPRVVSRKYAGFTRQPLVV